MKKRDVHTTIQIWKMYASGVHDVSMPHFNYKLIPPPPPPINIRESGHITRSYRRNSMLRFFCARTIYCIAGFCCYIRFCAALRDVCCS